MRLLPLSLTLLVLAMPLFAAAQPAAYVPIEQRLSTEQLRATGLDGLSPQQLQLLNRLLNDEQVVIEERVEKSARSRFSIMERQPPVPTQGTIVGEFRGWSAGKVIELDDGQRWRVTEGELFLRKPIPNAKATISPGMISGWYLQVEGQSPRAKVQRLP